MYSLYSLELFFANRKKLQFLSSNLNTHTERLRNVIDSVFTIILIIDEDGNILEANKTYADYLPENWEELPKKTFLIYPFGQMIQK